MGPVTASLLTWDQRDDVWWSYIRRLLLYRSPLTPNVTVFPEIFRSYTMPEKARGHQLTRTGVSPKFRFTSSCHDMILVGKARAIPLWKTPSIISSSRIKSALSAATNFGSNSAGIPSLGGPPDWISSTGILCLEKSQLLANRFNDGGAKTIIANMNKYTDGDVLLNKDIPFRPVLASGVFLVNYTVFKIAAAVFYCCFSIPATGIAYITVFKRILNERTEFLCLSGRMRCFLFSCHGTQM